jgi:hypothetical protein
MLKKCQQMHTGDSHFAQVAFENNSIRAQRCYVTTWHDSVFQLTSRHDPHRHSIYTTANAKQEKEACKKYLKKASWKQVETRCLSNSVISDTGKNVLPDLGIF